MIEGCRVVDVGELSIPSRAVQAQRRSGAALRRSCMLSSSSLETFSGALLCRGGFYVCGGFVLEMSAARDLFDGSRGFQPQLLKPLLARHCRHFPATAL